MVELPPFDDAVAQLTDFVAKRAGVDNASIAWVFRGDVYWRAEPLIDVTAFEANARIVRRAYEHRRASQRGAKLVAYFRLGSVVCCVAEMPWREEECARLMIPERGLALAVVDPLRDARATTRRALRFHRYVAGLKRRMGMAAYDGFGGLPARATTEANIQTMDV